MTFVADLDLPEEVRRTNLARIMQEAQERFNHNTTAAAYIRLYEKMLQRPVTGKSQAGA